MGVGQILFKTLGNMARTAVDAAASGQIARPDPQQPPPKNRRRKKAECTPCMARGAAVEARADVREMRKRVAQGDF